MTPMQIRAAHRHIFKPRLPSTVQRAEHVRIPFRQWVRQHLSHRFDLAPSRLHIELSETLESFHATRGQHVNRLAPRGAAKTSWATYAYPMYCALEGIEPHIALGADSGDQADEYIEDIREELEENESIRQTYWPIIRRAQMKKGRVRLGNGVMIRATSTGKRIRGRKNRGHRLTLVVIDDPQNLDHIISPLMRARSINWLQKDVMEAGTPQTNVIVLGTALHRECLVCSLERNPGWQSKLYRSIETWPERMDLWSAWEEMLWDYDNDNRLEEAKAFFEANRAEMERGAVVLWPERENLYELMMKRAMNGAAAFASEKQNDPVDPALCEWPPEYFRWPGIGFDASWDSLQLVNRIMALDPSKGRDARDGDYFAIAMLGLDHKQRQFVECNMDRGPAETRLATVCKLVREFKPEELVIETNQFQELIKPILIQTAKALEVELPRIVDCENRENKELRIRRLGPDLAQRSVRFKSRSPGTALLIEQGMDFPHGSHDDGLDAWEMARRRVKKSNTFELR